MVKKVKSLSTGSGIAFWLMLIDWPDDVPYDTRASKAVYS